MIQLRIKRQILAIRRTPPIPQPGAPLSEISRRMSFYARKLCKVPRAVSFRMHNATMAR